MSSHTTVTLDTTAPSVTWGAQTGTSGGELLRLAYTSDEAIASATIRLADNRVLALDVLASELQVLLPVDTPEGPATVVVRDDVLNARTYTALVLLGGVPLPAPAEEPTVPGWAGRRRSPARTRRRTVAAAKSTARVRSRATVASHGGYRTTAVGTSRTTIRTSRFVMSPVVMRTRGAVAARHDARTTWRVSTTPDVVTRRDGPDLEAAIALGLI